MTTLFMSHTPTPLNTAPWIDGVWTQSYADAADGLQPAVLVSYIYLPQWSAEDRARYTHREWMFDSGAFTAHASGKPVKHEAYLERALEFQQTDPRCKSIMALDVIGDWRGSMRNAEIAWERGVRAIPTFHIGSPWHALESMVKTYPRIALGGLVGTHPKRLDAFFTQVFARVWPARIHALGVMGPNLLLKYPFHSADSSSWAFSPRRFRRWSSLGGGCGTEIFNGPLPASEADGDRYALRGEIINVLRLEARLRGRWANELAILRELPE